MSTQKTLHLGTDSICALLLKFSIPAIFGLFIMASYSLVDRIFIGNGVGALGLAGVAVCFPVVAFQMACCLMIGVGGSVNFAVSLGERKQPRAERFFTNALFLIMFIAIVFTVVLFIFIDEALVMFGATEAIFPYAKTYLAITLCGSVFLMTKIVMNHFIRASGFPKYAMFMLLIGAIVNTILDAIFIFYLDLGIKGAAYATVIAQFISFLCEGTFFFLKLTPYRFRLKKSSISLKFIGAICAVGMAPFVIQLTTGLMQTILNVTLVKYGGDLAVSVMGATVVTTMVIFMPVIGLCEGAQPIIGFNLGAKNYLRLLEVLKITILLSVSFFILASLFLRFYAADIISVFNKSDLAFIEMGAMSLKTISMVYPLVGLSFAIIFFLQAVKNPRMSAFLALSRQLLFLIPGFLILPKFFGLEGVFIAFPVSDVIGFLVAFPVVVQQFRKFKKLERQKTFSELK